MPSFLEFLGFLFGIVCAVVSVVFGLMWLHHNINTRPEVQVGNKYTAVAYARALGRWRGPRFLSRWQRKRLTPWDMLRFTEWLEMRAANGVENDQFGPSFHDPLGQRNVAPW